MKKILLCLITIFASIVTVKADTNYHIEGYKTIGVNTTTNLIITDNIQDLSNYSKWVSSDESIVTVNEQGDVTGVQTGMATISAQYLISNSLTVLLGDMNGDGSVDMYDSNIIYYYFVNNVPINAAQRIALDVNKDSIVNEEDRELVQAYFYSQLRGGNLGEVDIPNNTAGLYLYYDTYATDEELTTIDYDVQVVDSIKSVSTDQVITTLKNTEAFKELISDYDGNVQYANNKIIVSYNNGEYNEISYDCIDGIIMYDSGLNDSDVIDWESFIREFFLGYIIYSVLESAGYSEEYIDSLNLMKATYEVNGFGFKPYGDYNEYNLYLSGQSYTFKMDMNHIYLSDDLKYETRDYSFIDEDITIDELISNKEITTVTKQAEEKNPSTGVSLPLNGLGSMILVAGGFIYYSNKKKAINRF